MECHVHVNSLTKENNGNALPEQNTRTVSTGGRVRRRTKLIRTRQSFGFPQRSLRQTDQTENSIGLQIIVNTNTADKEIDRVSGDARRRNRTNSK